MSSKKPNPLRGAFSTPVPGTPPDKATEEKPPTDLPAPKATNTTPDKVKEGEKSAELPKATPDPKATGDAPDKGKAGEKPAEPPKATPDPKVTSGAPDKGKEGEKPAEPPKATPDPKATGGTPDKDKKGEKPAEPPEVTSDPKAPDATPTRDNGEEIPKDFTLPITKEGQSEIITTMKISDIHPFEGHPFYVKDDKDMDDLVESVKKFGVLEPAVVIPRKEGGFEMVSGHRRHRACELAGIATMPVIVRQLDRDEATISMVDANLKRENISPMEKARAYKMKLEAMKHKAGRRTKEETAALEAAGKKPMRADEQLAQQTGESRANIQKIVRLNNLTPELQQMVEEKKLPVHTASDLSYLKKEEQEAVADAIKKEDKVPSGTQAAELKKASQDGNLTTEKIEKTVAPTKREVDPPLKVTLSEEDLRPYFPGKGITIPDVKRGIFEALDLRKKALERQKAKVEAEKGGKKPLAPAR